MNKPVLRPTLVQVISLSPSLFLSKGISLYPSFLIPSFSLSQPKLFPLFISSSLFFSLTHFHSIFFNWRDQGIDSTMGPRKFCSAHKLQDSLSPFMFACIGFLLNRLVSFAKTDVKVGSAHPEWEAASKNFWYLVVKYFTRSHRRASAENSPSRFEASKLTTTATATTTLTTTKLKDFG